MSYLNNIDGSTPRPILEYIVPQKGPDDYIGLTENGRTVNWMRNTQSGVEKFVLFGALYHPLTSPWIGAFARAGGLIGAAIGAAAGLGYAIYNRDVSIVPSSVGIGAASGGLMGLWFALTATAQLPSSVIAGVIASVIVPPVAGIANLVCAPYENNSHD